MTDTDTSAEAVERAIGMCRLHGLHGTEATLRALAAKLAEVDAGLSATLIREDDANRRAMQHLRRAEAAQLAADSLRSALRVLAVIFLALVWGLAALIAVPWLIGWIAERAAHDAAIAPMMMMFSGVM